MSDSVGTPSPSAHAIDIQDVADNRAAVDRVFAHALHTVKRIPRTGSARPPPADRLKLYGLYKQSTEGDVEGVMSRPRGDGEDVQSDQEKWDAWNYHKGLSCTEAKRQYITTLIETMHRYASQTADARELVSELEFVWDQIKSNSPSTTSSNPYNSNSPTSGRDAPIYPVMSEGGARNPGHARRKSLRAIDPVSQHSSPSSGDAGNHGAVTGPDDEPDDAAGEEFVDAPDSQLDEQSPERVADESKTKAKAKAREFGRQAGALVAPITKYWKAQTQRDQGKDSDKNGRRKDDEESRKWQRRVESALIKMNAEVAALREQLEMQQDALVHSSFLGSFKPHGRGGSRPQGWVSWFLGLMWGVVKTVVKHLVVDAVIVAAVTLWLHYHGVPAERLEQGIVRWVGQLRRVAFVRRLERMGRNGEMGVARMVTGLPRGVGMGARAEG